MDINVTETVTEEQIQAEADAQGIPGPKVAEHPEGYDGACFCQLCLSYGE